MPFGRLKVRLKKEIVTLGDPDADPTRQVGIYVEPADWNALIAAPDTLVIDTRNAFEVAMGTFEGAVDPKIASFGQFKDFVARQLDPAKHRKIAMFCTGGIRCEKASSLSARARLCRGLSSQGRHPEISGRGAGGARAAGAANVSCSTSASRSAMACGNASKEGGTPMSEIKSSASASTRWKRGRCIQDETIETLNRPSPRSGSRSTR